MAQVIDFNIAANPSGLNMRTELNGIIEAILTQNSGTDEPLNPFSGMEWVDKSDVNFYYIKKRNLTNDDWEVIYVYDVLNNKITPFGEIAYTIETVNDFVNIPTIYKTAIVKDIDRVGTFVWSPTGTANGGTVFAGATGYWTRQYSGAINVRWFGAKGDGVTDDTVALSSMLNNIPNNSVVDFDMGNYCVYNTITGTSGLVDSISLSLCLRLYAKDNIVLQNGTIFSYSANVSVTKLNYPTTLSIDTCTNITINNMSISAKGESFGNTDASAGMTNDERRLYAIQNGGHAVLVVLSENITINDTDMYLAGSVATWYSMSSNKVVLNNCYSAPMSFGYAAYAVDSWAGYSITSGFDKHYVELNNCSTDNNGATYGSKGAVVAEDKDVTIVINGGSFKDCYANASGHQIGYAFSASSATIIVNGARVDNCASVGTTSNTTNEPSTITINDVIATNIRTSMHIQASTSFGASIVRYYNCIVDVIGTATWDETELSISSVVANMKRASTLEVYLNNCNVIGADTLYINTTATYGTLELNGGYYSLKNRILDSAGLGSSSSLNLKPYGYIACMGAVFNIENEVLSLSKNNSSQSVIFVKNKDTNNVYTQQYINFEKDTKIICNSLSYHRVINLTTEGTGLVLQKYIHSTLVNCYDMYGLFSPKFLDYYDLLDVSHDGLSGSFVKVTFASTINRIGVNYVGRYIIANGGVFSKIESLASAVVVDDTNKRLQVSTYIASTSYTTTIGLSYRLI